MRSPPRGGLVFPWKTFQLRTSRGKARRRLGRVRVVLADPPAYTLFYEHELAAALVRAGVEVEVVSSPFRFGASPQPDGYRLSETFYPVSSRLFRRSRLRIPVKALEHPLGMVQLARRRADVVHVQWLAAPELDRFLLRSRAPLVFTAHDLLPRRTASKTALWRALFARFERIVVHSAHGLETLAAFGVPREKLRVIPIAAFRAPVERRDDGRTVLFFGIIRPYRGLDDALAVASRLPDSRLVVAGDPVMDVSARRASAPPNVEWRLGYLADEEVARLHAEATVAVFPYRPEIDQSGSMLRALGAGVPAVVYDVGGLAEPVRTFGAGAVVPSGDVEGLTAAVEHLLSDADALRAARLGAERARAALTWDVSARAHLDVYRELT
jgi:glycosyltransferase involved in cell wall biosynthesis